MARNTEGVKGTLHCSILTLQSSGCGQGTLPSHFLILAMHLLHLLNIFQSFRASLVVYEAARRGTITSKWHAVSVSNVSCYFPLVQLIHLINASKGLKNHSRNLKSSAPTFLLLVHVVSARCWLVTGNFLLLKYLEFRWAIVLNM